MIDFNSWIAQYNDTVSGGMLRIGQVLFNALYVVRPDLAEEIRATILDPFFADSWEDERIKNFLVFVENNW